MQFGWQAIRGLYSPPALLATLLDNVTACDLQFGLPPQTKNPGYAYVPRQCFFLTLITFD